MAKQRLDAPLATMLAQLRVNGQPPVWLQTPHQVRERFRQRMRTRTGKPVLIYKVLNTAILHETVSIPIRLYWPRESQEPLPVFIFFHGGSWMVGDLDSADTICRTFSREADCLVVSVDYRLAPEHKFPTAVEDCLAATRWVFENIAAFGGDTTRIALGGGSAGGNLATVTAQLWAAADGPSLTFQLLLYPITDLSRSYRSHNTFGEGYLLTARALHWYADHYARTSADRLDPRFSPMLFTDVSRQPSAFIATAGFDPLLDEGEAYAQKLEAGGVPVEYVCFPDLVHGFINFTERSESAKTAVSTCASALRQALMKELPL